MSTEWTSERPGTGDYAEVNGINLYYEIHGSGRPLVLLHGGLGSGEMFGPIIPRLSETHQVIAVDLQAHGRTADVERPIALTTMSDDIGALIGHLGVGRPDVMGYSLGGGVAFHAALRHPGLVRKLVLVSTFLRSDAVYEAMRSQQQQLTGAAAPMMRETPMYELYQRVAPRPEDFPRLLDKMGAWMAEPFDFTDQFRALQVPTLFVAADADMFPPSHAVEAFELLGGGQRDGGWMGEGRPAGGHALAILPGLQHYNVFASPLLAEAALAFLDAPEG
jgi:pimeloyl-ACP methyl ester carboxylesterase